MLINYANKNSIILELNAKDMNKNYPFLEAINNNNIKMVELLMKYTHKKQYYFRIERNNKDGNSLHLEAIY